MGCVSDTWHIGARYPRFVFFIFWLGFAFLSEAFLLKGVRIEVLGGVMGGCSFWVVFFSFRIGGHRVC